MGRARWLVPVDHRHAWRHCLVGRPIPQLGLAHSVHPEHRPRWDRAVDPARHPETPVFQKLLNDKKIERAPIVEVFKKQPKEILLSALVRLGQQSQFYIFTAFIFAYGVGTLHLSRDFILTAVLVASCVS